MHSIVFHWHPISQTPHFKPFRDQLSVLHRSYKMITALVWMFQTLSSFKQCTLSKATTLPHTFMFAEQSHLLSIVLWSLLLFQHLPSLSIQLLLDTNVLAKHWYLWTDSCTQTKCFIVLQAVIFHEPSSSVLSHLPEERPDLPALFISTEAASEPTNTLYENWACPKYMLRIKVISVFCDN